MADSELTILLKMVDSGGTAEICTLPKDDFVRIHDKYDGGDDVAYLEAWDQCSGEQGDAADGLRPPLIAKASCRQRSPCLRGKATCNFASASGILQVETIK